MTDSIIHLAPEFFQPEKRTIVSAGGLAAETFRFPSGVCGLRLTNERGEMVFLPFQGQQIWSARLDGRDLAMRSMFDQPYPTRDFLSNFGGFLIHCGGSAHGTPGQEANRPLHGELPNAPYEAAEILLGDDEWGSYIGLSGQYRCTVAFSYNFIACPVAKLYAGSSVFRLFMQIHNLKQTSMDVSYLAHINFRPADGGRLVTSALCDPKHMRVRTEIPPHIAPGPGYIELINDLAQHPEKHLTFAAGQMYDPELVLTIDCLADANGWTRQMLIHPDGSADVVRHRPKQLGRNMRWISRTPDQDAIGFEPATGDEHRPFIELGPKETFSCEIEIGTLTVAEVQAEEAQAQETVALYSSL